jgi:hypothetical protein
VLFNDSPQKLIWPFRRHIEFSLQEGYVNLEMIPHFSSFESLCCCKKCFTQAPVAQATQEAEIRRVGFYFSSGK